MKTIFYFLTIISFLSCKAQVLSDPNTNHNLPFVGTWEYQNGNEIFRINIWEDGEDLKGDYWFIEVNNDVETVICESNYQIQGTNFYYGDVIFGGSIDGVVMGALLDDNTINCEDGFDNRKRISGSASLTIQSNCFGCAVTALWEVVRLRGIRIAGSPTEFSVPNNVIMTKVN
jgi:hypothetical protein